ncbi:T9SS type A sorting domain-containing protein [Chryseobacterium sp. T1]
MKKVLLIAGIALIAGNVNAQESLTASGPQFSISAKAPTEIYNQNVVGSNGIVANMLSNQKYVACADDFVLDNDSRITKIKVKGFQNQANLETVVSTGLMVYIYKDANGKPNGNPSNTSVAPVAKFDLTKTSPGYSLVKDGLSYVYSLDVEAALGAGNSLVLQKNVNYWLVFAAKTNLTAYTAAARFNWYTGDVNYEPAKLIDPSNAFNAGATDWTNISDLTDEVAFDGLAFSIEGENALGVGEVFNNRQVVISPNPSSDFINISLENGNKVNSVEVYDVTGKRVIASASAQVDVRNLAKGTYVVKVQSLKGVVNQKFIKK